MLVLPVGQLLGLASGFNGLGESPDPNAAVGKLTHLLRPGALVCVVSQRVAADAENASPSRNEMFLFTPDALRALFGRNGFEAVQEETATAAGTFWFELKHEKRT